MSTDLVVRPYHRSDQTHVVKLWNDCDLVVPWNDPLKDIARKLGAQPDLLLVGETREVGTDESSRIVAERLLRELGCPKINLQVRSTNESVISFYETLGFSVDGVVNLGKRLIDDSESPT